eukprot:4511700-Pyramimonas_sp.AAC.1
MGPGRGPLDAVWRQAVRGEALARDGFHILSVLWDSRQFYEHVSHHRLWTVAQEVGYPVAAIQYSLNSYKWPRRLALEGLVSDAVFPHSGAIAGAGTATFEAKVHTLPTVDARLEPTTAAIPPGTGLATLTVHIDDSGTNTVSSHFFDCARMMYDRASVPAQLIHELMGAPLAMDKLTVPGSSQVLVEAFKTCLGELA